MKKLYYIITNAKATKEAKALLKDHTEFRKIYCEFAERMGSTLSNTMYSTGHIFGTSMWGFKLSGVLFERAPKGWKRIVSVDEGSICKPKQNTKLGKELYAKLEALEDEIPTAKALWEAMPIPYDEKVIDGTFYHSVVGMLSGKLILLTSVEDDFKPAVYKGAKRIETWEYEKMLHESTTK